jgi:predicted nucleic acid-binding protein
MVKALFDTNILVDYLNAVPQARTELRRYTEKAVSIITWMEVMVGAADDVEDTTRSFLSTFIKLPDAIIWATAQVNAMLLVTRNTRDFTVGDPGIRMPYRL